MKKVALIAGREFIAAVANKGFVIGLLLMPVVVAVLAFVGPRVMNASSTQISGEVAVIDPTGAVVAELKKALEPEAIARRRTEATARALANAPAAVRGVVGTSGTAIDRALAGTPKLIIVERETSADVQREKSWLTAAPTGARHLALVVVHPDAVEAGIGSDFGSYDVYVPANLDERVENTLYEGFREAVLTARIRGRQLDRAQVETVMRVMRPTSVTVTVGTERQTNVGFNRTLPFIFGGLLVFGIMIGGQTLLTSSSRRSRAASSRCCSRRCRRSSSWRGRSSDRWRSACLFWRSILARGSRC
jgi:ABC-type Na+ efflux pump permease subunit